MIDIDKAIATGIRTGKFLFGANSTVESAKTGKTKMVILAANCPTDIRGEVEYYCELSGVPVIMYDGSSKDLAATCGKPFFISALSIKDPGDSEIIKLVEEKEPEEVYGGTE